MILCFCLYFATNVRSGVKTRSGAAVHVAVATRSLGDRAEREAATRPLLPVHAGICSQLLKYKPMHDIVFFFIHCFFSVFFSLMVPSCFLNDQMFSCLSGRCESDHVQNGVSGLWRSELLV